MYETASLSIPRSHSFSQKQSENDDGNKSYGPFTSGKLGKVGGGHLFLAETTFERKQTKLFVADLGTPILAYVNVCSLPALCPPGPDETFLTR